MEKDTGVPLVTADGGGQGTEEHHEVYLLCPGRAYHIGILDVGLPYPASVLSSAGREMDCDSSPRD